MEDAKSLQISISSKTKKHDPTYYLTVTTSSNSQPRDLFCTFTTWFTADGYFEPKPFQQWLASSITEVGEADVKNAAASPDDEQSLADSGVNGATTGTDSKGKVSKRSKRKG